MKKMKLLLLMMTMIILASCQNDTESEMRIVSLMPSNTEIIAALGLLEDTVMVTVSDDYPAEVKEDRFKKIDPFNLEVEEVIKEKPTHIVSHESNSGMLQEELEQIEEATNAKVLIVEDATTVEDVFDEIEEVGAFLSKEEEAKTLTEQLHKDFESVREKAKGLDKVDTMVFVSLPPEIYTVGKETFISNVLKHVNLTNVFEDLNDYPVVTNEEVIKRNPQLAINIAGVDDKEFENAISDTPGFDTLDINNNENQCTPNQDIISRPGPRIIEGMNALLKCTEN